MNAPLRVRSMPIAERCQMCGRQMLPIDANPDDPDDPAINCAGDCWGCIRRIEAQMDDPQPITDAGIQRVREHNPEMADWLKENTEPVDDGR